MTPKYLKLWLILLVPLFLWLMWRGFASFLTWGGSQREQESVDSGSTNISPTPDLPSPTNIPSLWSTRILSNSWSPLSLKIAVPDWFDTTTMDEVTQQLKSEDIIITWVTVTGTDYHDSVRTAMVSGSIDLSLIASDRANDCGAWCALAFDYSQPIDAFVLSPVSEAIRDSYRTMIPYWLDPLVTFHWPKHRVTGSRWSIFNDILINSSDSSTAWSLPLAIGIWAADKALLRAGKESYPWYTEIVHQMMIQFSTNQNLLTQLTQLSDAAQLRSYPRMTKTIDTIADKFPICRETVAACLVRFTVSHYGFGYLTDLMRLPPSRSSTVMYDQFPVETNYYPMRLWWFVVNQRSSANTALISRFLSVYITNMINISQISPPVTIGNPLKEKGELEGVSLLSPFLTRYDTQSSNPSLANIMRYTDAIHIIRGGRFTALDRARTGGLMSVLEGNSSIQVYLSQQGIY